MTVFIKIDLVSCGGNSAFRCKLSITGKCWDFDVSFPGRTFCAQQIFYFCNLSNNQKINKSDILKCVCILFNLQRAVVCFSRSFCLLPSKLSLMERN